MNHSYRMFTSGLLILMLCFFSMKMKIHAQTDASAGNHGLNLPADFPEISIDYSNSPAPGNFFFGPFGQWGLFPDAVPYIVITDNAGIPLYFRKMNAVALFDFKLHPEGQLSFSGGYGNYYYIMDQNMMVVDSLQPSGYWIDTHEILIFSDSSRFVLGIDSRLVDMSEMVEGGQPDATVAAHVIQELDENNNVIFEWNCWDYFDILDTDDEHVDLTADWIDFTHVNTIEIDSDTTMIILPRNMNEVTRIDRRTGDIIWRIGGKYNQFTFIDDTLQWAWPHDIRKIGEGLYSMFDNGRFNTSEPHFSSCIIYEIDEENKTIRQVQRLRNDPDVYGDVMGSYQVLPGGNSLAGWGSGFYPNVTEFHPDGSSALEMSFESINYRVRKYNWQPRRFFAETNMLDFGQLTAQESDTLELTIQNNVDFEFELTGYHLRSQHFNCPDSFPLALPAGGQLNVQIVFAPQEHGDFEDVITLYADNTDTTERVGHQVNLAGSAVENFSIPEPFNNIGEVYPNPSDGNFNLRFIRPISGTVGIYNRSGRLVYQDKFKNVKSEKLNMNNFLPGVYLLQITDSAGVRYTTRLVRK